ATLLKKFMGHARTHLASRGQKFPEDTPPGVVADALAEAGNAPENERGLRTNKNRKKSPQRYTDIPPLQSAPQTLPPKDRNEGYAKKLSKAAKEASARANDFEKQWKDAHMLPPMTKRRSTHRDLAELAMRNHAHASKLHKEASAAHGLAGDRDSSDEHGYTS